MNSKTVNALGAIIWDFGHRHRVELVINVALIPISALLYRFLFTAGGAGELRALSALLPAVSLGSLALFLAYDEAEPRLASSGFPSRTFLLPVRSSLLVGIPFCGGMLAIASFYLAWALVIFRPIDIVLPLAWPALLAAFALAGSQTIAWSLGSSRGVRLFAYTILALLLFGLCVVMSDILPLGLPIATIHRVFFVALPVVLVGLYGIAVAVVSRSRRGEWPPQLRPTMGRRRNRTEPAGWPSMPIPADTSPARAQLWYEWRQHGTLIPTYSTLLLMIIMLVASAAQGDDLPMQLLLVAGVPACVCGAVGPSLARGSAWSSNLAVPQLLATRPLSNAALASAKLLILGFGIIVAWLLALATGIYFVARAAEPEVLSRLWRQLEFILGAGPAEGIAGMVGVLLLLFPWVSASVGLSIALTGRKELMARLVLGGVAFLVLLAVLVAACARDPENLSLLRRWISLLAGLIGAGGFAGTIYAFVIANRRRVLTPAILTTSVSLWLSLLVTAAVFGLLAGREVGGLIVAAGIALASLSVVPFAVAPLALAANRHA
jgi:hypothetical protein